MNNFQYFTDEQYEKFFFEELKQDEIDEIFILFKRILKKHCI